VISVRMDYLPHASPAEEVLANRQLAYVSRYALGRDYHKVMRRRLQTLAERIATVSGPFGYRAFVDSAPVLGKPLADQAGLGLLGKHANRLPRDAGSWFFPGEIYTDLPLPSNEAPSENHCGTCTSCIDICPTAAIINPYQVDARRCISYLTIELKGAIPVEFRKAMGNRIYGCDDCLAVCPWNKFAQVSHDAKLTVRASADNPPLNALLMLDDAGLRKPFRGTPIKRTGRNRFLRNVLIAAGNSGDTALAPKVEALLSDESPLVRAMAVWALSRLAPETFHSLRATFAGQESDSDVRGEWLEVAA